MPDDTSCAGSGCKGNHRILEQPDRDCTVSGFDSAHFRMYHGYGTDHPDRDTDLTSDRNLHRYRSGTVRYHHGIKLWYRPSDTAGWISSFHRFCSQRCKDGARGKSNPPVLSVHDRCIITSDLYTGIKYRTSDVTWNVKKDQFANAKETAYGISI